MKKLCCRNSIDGYFGVWVMVFYSAVLFRRGDVQLYEVNVYRPCTQFGGAFEKFLSY